MICWECKRVMGSTDITQERQCTEPKELKQTEYRCGSCGSVYVVTEHKIHGPIHASFVKNVVPSKEEENKSARSQNSV